MSFQTVTLNDVRVKHNSIKIMKRRGYVLGLEEEILDMSLEEILEYYSSGGHLTTSNEEIRMYYDVRNLPKKKKAILNISEKSDTDEYKNVHSFIQESINIGKQGNSLRRSLSNIYYHPKEDKYTMVYFANSSGGYNKASSFGEAEYRAILHICEVYGIYELIIISTHPPTAPVKNKIEDFHVIGKVTINEPIRRKQFFLDNELLSDIISHSYTPDYRLSSMEEFKKSYLYPILPSKITLMTQQDIIARLMGFKVGDIIFYKAKLGIVGSLIDTDSGFIKIVAGNKEKKSKGK